MTQKRKIMFPQETSQEIPDTQFEIYTEFKACTQFYARFHLLFLSFLFLQLLLFFLFLPHLNKSIISAFAPAVFLLTLFSYLVLLFFFQTKKTMQLLSLQKQFKLSQRSIYNSPIERAESATKEASIFAHKELLFYNAKTSFSAIDPIISKLKIRLHWKNFHAMKELLLLLSVEELTNLIKKNPTDLSPHTALAETYNQLSLLYLPPTFAWIPMAFFSEHVQNKFSFFSGRAIEEITILQDYGLDDPWVHTTLANIYHLQKKTQEEIAEYEILYRMLPENEEILSNLGRLYFQEGSTAKGLKIYEKLLNISQVRAEELITHYGSYTSHETSFLSINPS